MRTIASGLMAIGIIVLSAAAWAADPPLVCQAGKLKASTSYASCRLKTEATSVLKGLSPDFGKCDLKFDQKFSAAEIRAGAGECPTEGDLTSIKEIARDLTGGIGAVLDSNRFVASGSTIIDRQTGLEWEKKTSPVGSGVNLSDPHDVDNTYTWCVGTGFTCTNPKNPFDGSAAMDFLARLNGGTPGGCYAGRCDWRLPTVDETETIGADAVDVFQPDATPRYWSATTYTAQADAWAYYTGAGHQNAKKNLALPVRAVRTRAPCGNGTLDIAEQCDDGNLINGDSCETDCTVPVCGNYIVDFSLLEQCDDGNTTAGDGCSGTCMLEP